MSNESSPVTAKRQRMAEDDCALTSTSNQVADIAVRYRLLKGRSITDARLWMFFLVPVGFSEAVLSVLNNSQGKELSWSLGVRELPMTKALELSEELDVTFVPTFPVLLRGQAEANAEDDEKGIDEVDAVEILKSNDKQCLRKNYVIYHVYDHKRPYCSWKAALFISKEEHCEFKSYLAKMVKEFDSDFDECNQVLEVESWSVAKARRHGLCDCPSVTDSLLNELKENVAKKDSMSFMDYVDWNMDFCYKGAEFSEWKPDF